MEKNTDQKVVKKKDQKNEIQNANRYGTFND